MATRTFSRRSAAAAIAVVGVAPGPARGQPSDRPPDGGAFLETAFDKALRVTVPVWLNSDGPYDFVVDTGANRSVVSAEVAGRQRLPSAGMAPVHGIVSAEPAPLARVKRLRVGDVSSYGLELPVVPAARLGASGILGLDVMRDRYMMLGFRDHRFQITPSGRGFGVTEGSNSRVVSPDTPVTVKARYKAGQLVIVDAEAAGRTITAFLDSGSQVTVGNRILRDLVFSVHPELARRVVRSELISATGQRIDAEFAPLSSLRLGGAHLGDPLAAFADLHIFGLWDLKDQPTVLIGVDMLRRFERVGFDFARKRITFWRGHAPAETGSRAAGRPRG